MSKLLFAALAGVCLVSGCASTMLSNDRLTSNTAGVLGVSPSDISITDRREETPNTYYTVTTHAGKKYACVINGGGILAMGMTTPPTCAKK